MLKYIALLRGVNVGGHNVLKMNELKAVLTKLGLANVKTYIQSGNIVFQSEKEPSHLQKQIETEITSVFSISVPVIIRTALEWKQIIKNCPYPVDGLGEGESVHISFMTKVPSIESLKQIEDNYSEKGHFHINGKEIYLYLNQSFHTSKLPKQLQKLEVPATIRNWKTIKKIEMMIKEEK